MKKMNRLFAMALAVGTLCSTGMMAACGGGTGGGKVDKNTIVFEVFNGGYGYDWAEQAAEEWNSANSETTGYRIEMNPTKDEWYEQSANLQAGTAVSDIYIGGADYAQAATKGWIEDLSDVWNSTPNGENKTVRQKLKSNETDYVEMIFNQSGKYYGLPLATGFQGFIYDHELFLEKGYLIADEKGANGESKLISSPSDKLSAGRDGEYGTFDDGHPVDMDEYNLMINAISSTSNMYAYLWAGAYDYYLTTLFYNIYANYDGYEAFMGSLDLDLTYTNPITKESLTITSENGYEIYNMEGRRKAYTFEDTYLADPKYYHPASAISTTHTDAQKKFVYGAAYEGTTSDKQAAFLYDGVWWEREARANFNSLSDRGNSEYAYGTRDYRMMFAPIIDDNQVEQNRYIISSSDDLSVFVKKQSDASKLAAIKDFLTYLYSDKVLKNIDLTSGALVPFDYEISEAELNTTTKFIRNMMEIYASDKVQIIRKKVITTYSATPVEIAYVGSSRITYPIDAMQRGAGLTTKGDATKLFEDTYAYYKKNWSAVLG